MLTSIGLGAVTGSGAGAVVQVTANAIEGKELTEGVAQAAT